MYLSSEQQKVYDIITRRFIASFYPDCEVAHTHVIGQVATYSFKTSGKQIVNQGWRAVFQSTEQESDSKDSILPEFVKGEKGEHTPSFLEKETKPPNQFTEASLLRSMETAGKDIDDDKLRDLMKENGIGRPSTRASIIETLFRRNYILRNKKQILPTTTGIELIETIQNQLLKSAELTGTWEKKLKEIERGEYPAGAFIKQMKSMVDQLVYEVRSDTRSRSISNSHNSPVENKVNSKSSGATLIGQSCPKCSKGSLVKGTTAFGCSEFKKGCDFVLPFRFLDKKISENQYLRLLKKSETVQLKGFLKEGQKINGKLCFDEKFGLTLKATETLIKKGLKQQKKCPKCKKGLLLKGKTAYGCSHYKNGCDFLFPFDKLRKLAAGQTIKP